MLLVLIWRWAAIVSFIFFEAVIESSKAVPVYLAGRPCRGKGRC